MNALLILFWTLSLIVFCIGLLSLAYFPLAIIYSLRPRRPPVFESQSPLVSIIVPAYNEEKVIGHCIESILASNYQNIEVILVDDGSQDDTLAAMQRYVDHPQVRVISQPNAGKAAALNHGYSLSTGEIIFFVDADGIFTADTIDEMLKLFTSFKIGAVCGNDAPVNLDRLQTRLMCLQTHVGTSFVRRALAQINCLPIVSGNIGAFRRSALEMGRGRSVPDDAGVTEKASPTPTEKDLPGKLYRLSGPFREGFIGEDLELTWRVHRAGYQVAFAPHAIVLAEVPSTVKALWKQRVRWARGYLQTVRLHPDLFFNPRIGPLGLYLPLNFTNQVIIPLLQLVILVLLAILIAAGRSPIPLDWLYLLLWLGLGTTLFLTVISIALDKSWKDLRYLYVFPLWLLYSLMMNLVVVWALILEARRAPTLWNKLDRTGVITRDNL